MDPCGSQSQAVGTKTDIGVNSKQLKSPLHPPPPLRTQCPIVDNGRHAVDEFSTRVADLWADHAPRSLVAPVPLEGLLPDV